MKDKTSLTSEGDVAKPEKPIVDCSTKNREMENPSYSNYQNSSQVPCIILRNSAVGPSSSS